MRRPFSFIVCLLSTTCALFAADSLATTAQQKLDLIGDGKAKPGSTIVLTSQEANAWIQEKRAKAIPEGMRNERIDLGAGTADGSALVDFSKLGKGKGQEVKGLIGMLIEGERPLKISVRVESANGRCTVFLTRVELSGIPVEGSILDFLIKNFFAPRYPDAKINQPFDLAYNIDRIEVQPTGVRVMIKK
jgi:hypothetical protein